jgi:8-oxo-dGTP pyrophosphatase MutT (NUDIX family)
MNGAILTLTHIKTALTHPLPGKAGQQKMAPAPTNGGGDRWDIPQNYRQAGVLLLLYPAISDDNSLALALIRRPSYAGVHSDQISLPGGRREPGESLQTTALRETHEEIGVLSDKLTVIGKLSTLYTPPSNFCIYPFVAFCRQRPAFRLDSREVAELIEAPIHIFFDPALRREEIWQLGHYGKRRVPFFNVQGHKVWGATAMILSEFITLLEYQ